VPAQAKEKGFFFFFIQKGLNQNLQHLYKPNFDLLI